MDFVSPLVYIIVVVNIFINGDSVSQVNIANAINVAVNSAGVSQSIAQAQNNVYSSTPYALDSGSATYGTVSQYNYGNASNYAGDSATVNQAIGQGQNNAFSNISRPTAP